CRAARWVFVPRLEAVSHQALNLRRETFERRGFAPGPGGAVSGPAVRAGPPSDPPPQSRPRARPPGLGGGRLIAFHEKLEDEYPESEGVVVRVTIDVAEGRARPDKFRRCETFLSSEAAEDLPCRLHPRRVRVYHGDGGVGADEDVQFVDVAEHV